jgi:hypothetical protein
VRAAEFQAMPPRLVNGSDWMIHECREGCSMWQPKMWVTGRLSVKHTGAPSAGEVSSKIADVATARRRGYRRGAGCPVLRS